MTSIIRCSAPMAGLSALFVKRFLNISILKYLVAQPRGWKIELWKFLKYEIHSAGMMHQFCKISFHRYIGNWLVPDYFPFIFTNFLFHTCTHTIVGIHAHTHILTTQTHTHTHTHKHTHIYISRVFWSLDLVLQTLYQSFWNVNPHLICA